MSSAVDRYVKRVRKKLFASAKTKARLIDGLLASISEFDEEPSYDDLVHAFGTPAQAAAELQSCVDESEVECARNKSKRIVITLCIMVVILALVVAIYVSYEMQSNVEYVNSDILNSLLISLEE